MNANMGNLETSVKHNQAIAWERVQLSFTPLPTVKPLLSGHLWDLRSQVSTLTI